MKQLIKKLVRKLGYNVTRYDPDKLGYHQLEDIQHFCKTSSPLIFDVGANVGQSIDYFRTIFSDSTIHSFEPNPDIFPQLQQHSQSLQKSFAWNFALGSKEEQLAFEVNSASVMSSFLPLSEFGGGEVTHKVMVNVRTLDQFCQEQDIEYIDVIKSDTQGFDLEVFKGSQKMIDEGKIGMIYFEITFSDMYKGLPSLTEIYEFLTQNNFHLIAFYDFHYQKRIASWTDALFVHKSYL